MLTPHRARYGSILAPDTVHSRHMIYGYARVSIDGPSVAVQTRELRAAGCATIRKDAQLGGLIAALEPGDVVVVTALDCLASTTHGLLKILTDIIARKADFRSLTEPWADTTAPHADILLAVL